MKIIDVLNAPWAIEPTKLLEIQAIYATHLRGDKIDISAIEKQLGRPLDNKQRDYEIVDGVAILSMEGVMAKKMNLFSQISGGCSTQILRNNINSALIDSAVHSLIIVADTPGGTVDGTQLLVNDIANANTIKPVVTWANGCIASAGYWAGSASSKIYISDFTTAVGSIGVVCTHVDISEAEKARGVKTTEITAGKYKRIASQYGELSAEGMKSIQDQADYLYEVFVNDVAKNRGVSAEKVLSDMADGRIFMGQQAIDAGLVDGVSTIEALIEQLNQDQSKTPAKVSQANKANQANQRAGAAHNSINSINLKGTTMQTAEQIASEHPEAAATLRAQGAEQERARIKAVEDQTIAGHEALINTLKFDGVSTGGDAAQAVLAAEKSQRTAQAAALAADAPQPIPQASQSPVAQAVADAQANVGVSKADLDAKAKEYMTNNPEATYVQAYKAVGGK